MITAEKRDNACCIILCDRIDSTNATEIENDINVLLSKFDMQNVVLDAKDLKYTSSAGLRVILSLRKKFPSLKIINVSSDVYEVFESTGFTEIIKVEKAFKTVSIEGCKEIGRGAKSTLYSLTPDTAIKVYKDPDSLATIMRERELARTAFILGIPTAISFDVVKVGDTFGSVFELLNAHSFSQILADNPDKLEECVKEFTLILQRIHNTVVDTKKMPDVKILIRKWISDCAVVLGANLTEKISMMVEQVPDTHTMIHGDYHTNNLMKQGDETMLIDMDTLSYGHPVFELANIRITYVNFGEFDSNMTENFYGFSCDKAREIWDLFLHMYLNSEDVQYIQTVDEKINILAILRLIRHYVRRGACNTEEGKKLIELNVQRLRELTDKTESLIW